MGLHLIAQGSKIQSELDSDAFIKSIIYLEKQNSRKFDSLIFLMNSFGDVARADIVQQMMNISDNYSVCLYG